MSDCVVGWSANGFKIPGSFTWLEFFALYRGKATPEIINGDLVWIVDAGSIMGTWVKFLSDHPDRWLELITAANLGCHVGKIKERQP